MAKSSARRLSIVDAAKLLYRTDAPSDQQVGRVYERMKAGMIRVQDRATTPREWTTTEQDLADFVAAEMVKRQSSAPAAAPSRHSKNPLSRPGTAKTLVASTPQVRDAQHLKQVYHSIWRDAFLAVMLRRRIAHRSATFHRWALVGQITLLVSLVGTAVGLVRITTERSVPEHAAIEQWIDENTDFYEVQKWHPVQPSPDGTGVTVEVEYRYTKESRRMITTRRTLLVLGDSVSEVTTE